MLNILKCKHDPNKEEHTLEFINNKMVMTFPPKHICRCKHCNKVFTFVKDENTQKFTKA